MRSLLILITTLFITANYTLAQQKRFKGKTTFGMQVSPIFTNDWLQKNSVDITLPSNVRYTITPKPSILFGMEVRHDFTERVALQSGINYIRRNYNVGIIDQGVDIKTLRMKFLSYEIPVLGLLYVRISDDIYMNNAFGFSFNFTPSNINFEEIYVLRKSWFHPGLLANIGWEYRTKSSGNFYLGVSYQYFFEDMFGFHSFYEGQTVNPKSKFVSTVSGNYFCINFKYFFATKK